MFSKKKQSVPQDSKGSDKFGSPRGDLVNLTDFWNSETYKSIPEHLQEKFHDLMWEVEKHVDCNSKPCRRCGCKPQWGQYYCESCKNLPDQLIYQQATQLFHEWYHGIGVFKGKGDLHNYEKTCVKYLGETNRDARNKIIDIRY